MTGSVSPVGKAHFLAWCGWNCHVGIGVTQAQDIPCPTVAPEPWRTEETFIYRFIELRRDLAKEVRLVVGCRAQRAQAWQLGVRSPSCRA